MFFEIAASVTGTFAVNPNGIKKLLVNGLSTFFIIAKRIGPKSLPRNPPDCRILWK